jgi:NAD(P)-dependent dehydrogenase (short-subunit alcohol dehydrogenase family)
MSHAERMETVEGPVVVVTGGANGIGRAYCESLVARGAAVVVADVDIEAGAALAKQLNDGGAELRAVAVEVDVTSPASTLDLASQALAAFGRIDVLVNNAGTYPHEAFETIDYEKWRRVLALNLDSVFLCSQAVVEPMRQAGGGKIVNIATNLVWTGLANMAHYIAAKAGVIGLTRALARELGEDGITVNAIAPGAVPPPRRLSTEGQARMDEIVSFQCIKRMEQPGDLTGMLLFLCSSGSDFISGQVFTVDGGLTTH